MELWLEIQRTPYSEGFCLFFYPSKKQVPGLAELFGVRWQSYEASWWTGSFPGMSGPENCRMWGVMVRTRMGIAVRQLVTDTEPTLVFTSLLAGLISRVDSVMNWGVLAWFWMETFRHMTRLCKRTLAKYRKRVQLIWSASYGAQFAKDWYFHWDWVYRSEGGSDLLVKEPRFSDLLVFRRTLQTWVTTSCNL